MKYNSEAEFQLELSKRFEVHGHAVFLHDAGTSKWPKRFRTNGIAPDLFVRTNPLWEYHSSFPVLGVEVKINDEYNISDAVDGFCKVIELSKNEDKIEYWADGIKAPKPSFYLLATPPTVNLGYMTAWSQFYHGASHDPNGECCKFHTTRCFALALNRFKASIIVKGGFEFQGHIGGKQYNRLIDLRVPSKVRHMHQLVNVSNFGDADAQHEQSDPGGKSYAGSGAQEPS